MATTNKKKQTRTHYQKEFKSMIVRRVKAGEKPVDLARKFNIRAATISNWVNHPDYRGLRAKRGVQKKHNNGPTADHQLKLPLTPTTDTLHRGGELHTAIEALREDDRVALFEILGIDPAHVDMSKLIRYCPTCSKKL